MRVLLVDDDALIRDGLKVLLELEPDIEVAGTAADGRRAFELCGEVRPDLVLMDIRMPELDGVLGTKMIKERYPEIKIVILTTFKDVEYIREALKSGAEGYILKNQSADSIVESLRAVAKGNTVFEKEIVATLASLLGEEKQAAQPAEPLTARELEVLALVGEGLSNREIAARLYLGDGTVRNYVTGLLEKLGLRDRTQLAIYYLKNYGEI